MTVADDQALAKAVVEEMTNTKVDVVSMRWTRLQKKLASGGILTADDHALIKAIIESLGNRTLDYNVIGAKLGGNLNKAAISMRWTRLQKKWGIYKPSARSTRPATPKKTGLGVKQAGGSAKKGAAKRKLLDSDGDSDDSDLDMNKVAKLEGETENELEAEGVAIELSKSKTGPAAKKVKREAEDEDGINMQLANVRGEVIKSRSGFKGFQGGNIGGNGVISGAGDQPYDYLAHGFGATSSSGVGHDGIGFRGTGGYETGSGSTRFAEAAHGGGFAKNGNLADSHYDHEEEETAQEV
jgi:hypothetical protein